jgi:hypothetical protein
MYTVGERILRQGPPRTRRATRRAKDQDSQGPGEPRTRTAKDQDSQGPGQPRTRTAKDQDSAIRGKSIILLLLL